MFELTPPVLEEIVFAMEDQSASFRIDMTTGKAVLLDETAASASNFEKPPAWNSRDGFRIMEGFYASLRNPEMRSALGTALSRGKGVFKAFKEALAASPEMESLFLSYKKKCMKPIVLDWLNYHREAAGLARLAPPPDDDPDLSTLDFDIDCLPLADAPEALYSLVDKAVADMPYGLPAALLAGEKSALISTLRAAGAKDSRKELGGETDSRVKTVDAGEAGAAEKTVVRHGYCAYIHDTAGGLIAAAFGYHEEAQGRAYGRIRFLYVTEGFRLMGLGHALLVSLQRAFAADGVQQVLLDSVLLPADYGDVLKAKGYRNLGLRMTLPPHE